jgi:hypothetical protein
VDAWSSDQLRLAPAGLVLFGPRIEGFLAGVVQMVQVPEVQPH